MEVKDGGEAGWRRRRRIEEGDGGGGWRRIEEEEEEDGGGGGWRSRRMEEEDTLSLDFAIALVNLYLSAQTFEVKASDLKGPSQ